MYQFVFRLYEAFLEHICRGGSRIFLSPRGAPLRNDVTDGEGKKIFKANTYIRTRTLHLSGGGGGGAHPLHPPPRSAPDLVCGGTEILLVVSTSFQTGKKCFKKFSMKEKKSVSRLTLEASAFIDYDGYLLSCKNLQSDF